MAVRPGDQWGRIICLYVGKITHKEYAKDAHGQEYEAEISDVPGYSLRCDCGKEWDVEAKDFQGKRVVRDCGCGLSGVESASIVKAFSTKNDIYNRIVKYATSNKMNFSHALNKLATMALDAIEKGKEVEAAGAAGLGSKREAPKPWGESDTDETENSNETGTEYNARAEFAEVEHGQRDGHERDGSRK